MSPFAFRWRHVLWYQSLSAWCRYAFTATNSRVKSFFCYFLAARRRKLSRRSIPQEKSDRSCRPGSNGSMTIPATDASSSSLRIGNPGAVVAHRVPSRRRWRRRIVKRLQQGPAVALRERLRPMLPQDALSFPDCRSPDKRRERHSGQPGGPCNTPLVAWPHSHPDGVGRHLVRVRLDVAEVRNGDTPSTCPDVAGSAQQRINRPALASATGTEFRSKTLSHPPGAASMRQAGSAWPRPIAPGPLKPRPRSGYTALVIPARNTGVHHA